MAGHSKWANIKRQKEKTDAKRGKIFSRISKEIINAIKLGGSTDPKINNRLRIAIQHAKAANFPSDNIDRVIKKASASDQELYHEFQYELYGHEGVGIILDIMTNNKNRIASEIRVATNKRGGSVAVPGAVSFNFERKGVILFTKNHALEEELFTTAIDAGADDFSSDEESFIILTSPQNFYDVKTAVENLGLQADSATIEMIPKSFIEVSQEGREANLALLDWLESIDDVDALYHNMKIPE